MWGAEKLSTRMVGVPVKKIKNKNLPRPAWPCLAGRRAAGGRQTGEKLKMKAGFTLVEFMIVIAILLILAAIAIPQFGSYSKRQVLLTETDQLVTGLKTVQGKAKAGVQDDPSGITIKAFFVSSFAGSNTYDLNRRFDGTSAQISSHTMESPITISSWPGNISFSLPKGSLVDSAGSLVGSSQTIRVCYTDVGYHDIIVEPTGRIYRNDRGGPPC